MLFMKITFIWKVSNKFVAVSSLNLMEVRVNSKFLRKLFVF